MATRTETAAATAEAIANKTEASMTDFFDQAVGTFGDALKAGVNVQEDMAKWWAGALDQGGPMQEWQKRSREIVTETVPAMQRNAEEWVRVMEQNYRRSMDLMRQAMESGRASSPTDMQARTRVLWEASLDAVRDNARAMAQVNVKAMELWSDVMRKNMNGHRAVRAAVK